MAKNKSLATLSLDALVKLRDDVTEALSNRASELRRQLSSLTGTSTGAKRGPKFKSSRLKGPKVAAKYRSKKDAKLTWAGRGATPRWMRDEMKVGKLKKEAFLLK
jgi:DNA-binding protein H-NS